MGPTIHVNFTQEKQQALPGKDAQPEAAREALAEKDTNSSSKAGEVDTLDLTKDDNTGGKPSSPTVDLTKEGTSPAGTKRKSPPLTEDDDDDDDEGSDLDDFEIPPGATLDSADACATRSIASSSPAR